MKVMLQLFAKNIHFIFDGKAYTHTNGVTIS